MYGKQVTDHKFKLEMKSDFTIDIDMKLGDIKSLVVAGLMLQGCAASAPKIGSEAIENQLYETISHPVQNIRENKITKEVILNGSIVSGKAGDWVALAQQRPNDCGKICQAMVQNHYLGDTMSARDVEKDWSEMFPLAHQFNKTFLHGQDLFVYKIAHYLNDKLADTEYHVTTKPSTINDQQMMSLLDEGGSAMIAIHSEMGGPHWVIVIGYYLMGDGTISYKIINPSGTLMIDGKVLCYNDKTQDQDRIAKDNDPTINIISSDYLNVLHKFALLNTGFDWKKNIRIIVIEKKK